MHEAIRQAVREHGETSQEDELLTAWVLVCETRDVDGHASLGYYRGPGTGTTWIHRGMLATADRYIASEEEREDGDG